MERTPVGYLRYQAERQGEVKRNAMEPHPDVQHGAGSGEQSAVSLH